MSLSAKGKWRSLERHRRVLNKTERRKDTAPVGTINPYAQFARREIGNRVQVTGRRSLLLAITAQAAGLLALQVADTRSRRSPTAGDRNPAHTTASFRVRDNRVPRASEPPHVRCGRARSAQLTVCALKEKHCRECLVQFDICENILFFLWLNTCVFIVCVCTVSSTSRFHRPSTNNTQKALKKVNILTANMLKFRQDCKTYLQKFVCKIMNRSPLTYTLTKAVTCLNPNLIASNLYLVKKRLNNMYSILIEKDRLTGPAGGTVVRQFREITSRPYVMDAMKSYSRSEKRLDHFWRDIIIISRSIKNLKILCM